MPYTIFSNQAIKRHKLPLRTQTNLQLNTNFLTVHHKHKSESPSLCVFYITPFKKLKLPPRLELRSTSQRNNRNVLGIETRQSKNTKFPKILNRPGFQRVELFGSAGKRGGYRGRGEPMPLQWAPQQASSLRNNPKVNRFMPLAAKINQPAL